MQNNGPFEPCPLGTRKISLLFITLFSISVKKVGASYEYASQGLHIPMSMLLHLSGDSLFR